jgi:hypothetical protein
MHIFSSLLTCLLLVIAALLWVLGIGAVLAVLG